MSFSEQAQLVGLQPTVIASRAPHLLLEQSVMIQRIVDVHRPSKLSKQIAISEIRATGVAEPGGPCPQKLSERAKVYFGPPKF